MVASFLLRLRLRAAAPGGACSHVWSRCGGKPIIDASASRRLVHLQSLPVHLPSNRSRRSFVLVPSTHRCGNCYYNTAAPSYHHGLPSSHYNLLLPLRLLRMPPLQRGEKAGRASWFSSSSTGRDRSKQTPKGKYLNLKGCKSVQAAAKMAFERLDMLKPNTLAAFWTKVSQLAVQKPKKLGLEELQQLEGQLNSILSKTMETMASFQPRDLAQTALGFAKTTKAVERQGRRRCEGTPHQILQDLLVGADSKQKDAIFQSIADASVPLLSKFDARRLSNLSYAYAIAGQAPVLEDGTTLFGGIAERSIPLVGMFKPQEISNLVWSFEKVGASNPPLFQRVADHITGMDRFHLGKFEPQGLSNIVLAFTKAGESNSELFREMAGHIVSLDSLHKFEPQALANTVWAYAKAGELNPMLFQKMADHILALGSLYKFSAQNLANTVWAYANAGVSNPQLFQKVSDHVVSLDSLHKFSAQALANTVWAFAKAGESNPILFRKVADHIVSLDSLHKFNAQELGNTVWAFAKAGVSNPKLFLRVADHIVSLDNLNKFSAQALANTVWAYAKAGVSHPMLFQKVADHILALDNLRQFNEQALGNTVWAFAKAGVSHPRLYQKVADHILALDSLHSFNEKVCTQILWSFGEAGIVNTPMFEKVAAHANMNVDFKNLDKKSQMALLRAYEKAEDATKKSE